MDCSRLHSHPGVHATLYALLVLLAASAVLLARADAAPAAQIDARVLHSAGSDASEGAVSLRIEGAKRARSIALYVDGGLRGRDRSWPWDFGRIHLKKGRHKLTASARFRRRAQVLRRIVVVKSSRRGGSIGVSKNRRVKEAPAPAPAGGPILWRGDFETGDVSQWDMVQRVASDRITIAQDPRRQGNYAARFEVRPGDNIGDTSPRAELASYLGEHENEERYYRWFTYFDPGFPTDYEDDFVTFTQWRAVDESDAYTSFMVWGDEIELRRDGTRWSTPLVKGVWHEFIYHVKWSPDPDVGFIELWYDGQLVMPKVRVETMAGSPGDAVQNYVKQGLYKEDVIPTGVVYHDGFVSGTSLDAVKGA